MRNIFCQQNHIFTTMKTIPIKIKQKTSHCGSKEILDMGGNLVSATELIKVLFFFLLRETFHFKIILKEK